MVKSHISNRVVNNTEKKESGDIYIHISVYICGHTHICAHMWTYTYLCAHMWTYTYGVNTKEQVIYFQRV